VLQADAVRNLLRELVGHGDASLMVEEFPPGDVDADTAPIADAAQTPPFLTDRRIVVCRDVNAYASAALDPVLRYLDDPLPSTSLVLTGGKGISPKLVNAVKKVGTIVEAGAPVGKGRKSWLADHLRAAPVRLDPSAVELLDKHLGEDLGRLTNVLESLAAAYGRDARVTAEEVEPFLGEQGSVPPWELTDAIDGGRTGAAVSALQRMMMAGERHPLAIMATLHTHYARMLRLDGAAVRDEAQAAEALGMKGSTFPARKALTQARRLGHDGVVEAMRLLAEADLDLRKFTKDWPEHLVMEVLVARLSRLGPRRA
jgi:DNA polymerase-3 subunit delta